ncbi:MAG: hypothetical protein ACKVRN_14960 [Pyrinomonadaceae bacterium]
MRQQKLSVLSDFLSKNSNTRSRVIILAGGLFFYLFFISGLSTNPGGFYYDEACEAYNGYLIATTGVAQNGKSFPLFFQCYTGDFIQWMSPLYIYSLAAMYLFVAPSELSAHILSATFMFIAVVLLGVLAARISGRDSIGIIVALTAMLTPWLFEVSRLAHEPTLLSLGIALFLLCLYNAQRRENWKLVDSVFLALSLANITYSYAAGRILAPAFALGLLIFAANRRVLFEIFKTWAIYFVLLIPFIIGYLTNRDAITARFREVGYITPDTSWWVIATEFVSAFFRDISPTFLLFDGDHLLRHHIKGMGGIFAVTLLLSIFGFIIVLMRHRRDRWWLFILYGFVISILPGALTVHRQHYLRLIALPIFLLILTIPGLSFLVDNAVRGKLLRLIVLALLLTMTGVQAVYFQLQFRKQGPEREVEFHKAYPEVLDRALKEPSRPIYLRDGRYGPAYILALWYGTGRGIDLSNFYHLAKDEAIPPDSLVLASDQTCTNCKVIMQKSVYLLYRTSAADSESDPSNAAIIGSEGNKPGEFSRPRGVAADSSGNFYVADTGNHRIQKFDSDGDLIRSFGESGKGVGQLDLPNGIAMDARGNIYVTDAANNKLIRFGTEGEFQKEWAKPEVEFYGPRDIAIDPDGNVYIVDQGRSRIVKFAPETEAFDSFGSRGDGDGEFNEPSGIAVGDGLVFVTDAGNKRVQVFDLDGNFVRQWSVNVWEGGIDSYPDCIFDAEAKRLYVTSEQTYDVIAFDVNGNPIEKIDLSGNIKLNKPASISLSKKGNTKTLLVLDITDSKVAIIPLTPVKK